tara:strand:- start:4554 stop:4907 length:354 start_codon:yes stop_codon:yes gene_type:complete
MGSIGIVKNTVILDFELVGFHYYEQAPKQVEFLKHNHRHNFQFRLGYNVNDLDREIEIFITEDFIKQYLTESYGSPLNFEQMSCEMIANELLEFAHEDGCVWVEVFEDGKGGAKAEL